MCVFSSPSISIFYVGIKYFGVINIRIITMRWVGPQFGIAEKGICFIVIIESND